MIECCRCALNYSSKPNSDYLDEIMLYLIACQRGFGRLISAIESMSIATIGYLFKTAVPKKCRGPQIRLLN